MVFQNATEIAPAFTGEVIQVSGAPGVGTYDLNGEWRATEKIYGKWHYKSPNYPTNIGLGWAQSHWRFYFDTSFGVGQTGMSSATAAITNNVFDGPNEDYFAPPSGTWTLGGTSGPWGSPPATWLITITVKE